MDAEAVKPPFAWQPLTPSGVAAFAQAKLGHLLWVQLVVALLAGGTVGWFLHRDWFPVVTRAIEALPSEGQFNAGRLDWHGNSPQLLAQDRFLALTVDLGHGGGARSPAHVQVEFGEKDIQIFSLLGFAQVAYPQGRWLPCNRPELTPRWGAWAPAILTLVIGAVAAGLILVWAVLASVYCWPVWLLGFFADRDLSAAGSWRLAGAAVLPGALFMLGAIVLYGFELLDPIHLLAAGAMHLVIGWVYLAISPFRLPRHPAAGNTRGNPWKHKA